MKKITSIFLALGLLITVCLASPFAADSTSKATTIAETKDRNESKYLFKQTIEERFADQLNQFPNYAQLEVYDELFYHYDSDGEIDWALIRYRIGKPQGPLSLSLVFGNVIVRISNIENNRLGMSVYDVKKDELVPITDGGFYDVKPFDYSEYNGFEEALLALAVDWNDPGNNLQILLLGDVDNDKEISIIDATLIQRDLVGLVVTGIISDQNVSDFDKDGDVTILDATAIQRHLAGLE